MTQLVHALKSAQLQVLSKLKTRMGLLLSVAFILAIISTYSFNKTDIPGDSIAAMVILNILSFPLGLLISFFFFLLEKASLPVSSGTSNFLLVAFFGTACVLQFVYVDTKVSLLGRSRKFFVIVGLVLAIGVALLKTYSFINR